MSPHAVNNFVSDLVLMAQAMEELPKVKAEVEVLLSDLDTAQRTIQDRELAILDYKDQLKQAGETIRSLEVAKDQAETMFLEADDRTARALDFVKAQFGAAGSLIQALEPVKPMPEPVAGTSIHDTSSGHVLVSASTPIPADSPALVGGESSGAPIPGNGNGDPQSQSASPLPSSGVFGSEETSQSKPIDTTSAQGQSVADPTLITPHQEPSSPNAGGGTTGAALEPQAEASTSSWASPIQPKPKPSYANEPWPKYSDVWYKWSDDMDGYYGFGQWPSRP